MRVEVRAEIARPLAEVWALARDFTAPWHPLIASMRDECGVRAFTVAGETTVYREKLTFLSDSEYTIGYMHLEGIAGCESYRAELRLQATEAGTQALWTAEIEAAEPRLSAICAGTEQIFAIGLQALETAQLLRLERVGNLTLLTNGKRGDVLQLFLHGIGGAKENWAGQIGSAPAAAMDLRGYGGSLLGPAQSTLQDHFADILAVKQTFGARKLHLVGLSLGAWIATAFACAYPQELSALTLIGGCTGMSEAPPQEREAFRLSREVPLSQGLSPKDFAPAVVNIIAGPNASSETRATLLQSMSAIPAATYRDALNLFTTPPGPHDFARLTMPVTLLTGEHDRLASPAEIAAVACRISRFTPTRFEVIQGAGHVCNIEAPDQVNRFL